MKLVTNSVRKKRRINKNKFTHRDSAKREACRGGEMRTAAERVRYDVSFTAHLYPQGGPSSIT